MKIRHTCGSGYFEVGTDTQRTHLLAEAVLKMKDHFLLTVEQKEPS